MLLKKKKPLYPQEHESIKMKIEELPTKALELTYQEFMKEYEKTKKTELQQKMVLISKILNDRAYDQGNGRLKQRAKERFPSLTDEQFDKMPRTEKDKLQKFLDASDQMKRNIEELAKPEPETIEFEMPAEITATIKQDQTKNDTHVTLEKPKKKGFFSKLNEPVFQKDKPKTLQQAFVEKAEKKSKKPALSFLKKKKKKVLEVPISDEVVQTIDKIKQEQPELFEKKVTDDQKKRAKKMEMATVKAMFNKPLFKKNIDPNKRQLDLKRLDEIYCDSCKHSIKAHQKGGVSSGCNKCGCLSTIEEIAEEKGIPLYKPREVLDKIEAEHSESQQQLDEEYAKAQKQNVNEMKREYVEKQAEKLVTMQKKPAPKPQMSAKPKPKPKLAEDVQCICDHNVKDHFDNVEFCTVIGCSCKQFKEYPK